MGLFIKLKIDSERCVGIAGCGKCLQVCPVQILGDGGEFPLSIVENEDECTLCDLCLDVCDPDAIRVRKLYE